MRLVLPLFALSCAYAQVCAPGRIPPAGAISGTLDDASCFLSDSTAYASYRLDVPVRGRVRLTLTTAEDFLLVLRDASGAKLESGASIRRPLEAGAYTMLVNARVPGQVGSFLVRSEFTAEQDVLCRSFPPLGLSQRLDATLGAAGCKFPDGGPADTYLLSTFGEGTLTVNVAADWSPAIVVRTADGAALAAGDSTVTAILDRETQYHVVVATADRVGAYRISTTFTPAETETCRPGRDLTAPSNDDGSVTPESCTLHDPLTGDLLYFNYYPISVSTAGVADFTATSSDFGAALALYDEAGSALATDAGGGDSGGARIRMHLRPGNYVARVLNSTGGGGAYRFTYSLTPGAPRPCETAPLDLATGRSASLSSGSCRTEFGLADIHTLTLPASGALDLTLTPVSALNAVVALRDRKDNLLVLSRDVQNLGIATLSVQLPAGEYTVVAAAGAGAGFYQLTGSFTERDAPTCPAPQTVAIDGGWGQRLGPFSCRGANGAPVDYYQFTLPSEAVTALIMTSSDVDGHLTLMDASGAVLRTDDNSYGLGEPLIVDHLPAGTYRLAARASSGTQGGLYQVHVRTALEPRPPFCAPKAVIPIGNTVSGTISFSGCQYVDDTFADIYRIEVTEPGTLDIRLASAEFDAYLVLLDAKGNLIDRDDDGGGNRDARIISSLQPGSYFIVAKPAQQYTAGGAYTISVQ